MAEPSAPERFTAALAQLLPTFAQSEDRLALAVSGGPDSLALLELAHATIPDRISVATVDHKLRAESAEEADLVASICCERGIPHRILTPGQPILGNIQAEARRVRYRLLEAWMARDGLQWLATAHHADDQLETMLMRILRGSGIDGMSAIRAKRGQIVRPLLGFAKAELEAIVSKAGLRAVDDPSNRDHSFDRVRLRAALDDLQGFDVRLAAKSAHALNDARDALHWMVDRIAAEKIAQSDNEARITPGDWPAEIERRLLLRCLHLVDPSLSPRGNQIDELLASLHAGETSTLGDIMCSGGKEWRFTPAPPRKG